MIPETVFILCTSTRLRCICTDAGHQPLTDQDTKHNIRSFTLLTSSTLSINFPEMSIPTPASLSLQPCQNNLYSDTPFPITLVPEPFPLVSRT